MIAKTKRTSATKVNRIKGNDRKWLLGLSAVVAFAVCLSAPATVTPWGGIAIKSAYAKSDKAGGGGHGNGRGNGGRSGSVSSGGSFTRADSVLAADKDDNRDSYLLFPLEEITMAMFTTRISKRYPADEVTTLNNPHQAISFFSEIKDMAGKQIDHLWYFEGELQFKASFNIRTNRWRTWSTQLLPEDMAGLWTVEVVDETGKVLETRELLFAPSDGELVASR